jgi:hypothetical protein
MSPVWLKFRLEFPRGHYRPLSENSRGTSMKTIYKGGIVAVAFAATLTSGIVVGQALAGQPHMRAALDDLRAARDQLQDAEHNKGGHRVAAIRLTNESIDEVQAGIDHAEW